jgi:hypothetical protein
VWVAGVCAAREKVRDEEEEHGDGEDLHACFRNVKRLQPEAVLLHTSIDLCLYIEKENQWIVFCSKQDHSFAYRDAHSFL